MNLTTLKSKQWYFGTKVLAIVACVVCAGILGAMCATGTEAQPGKKAGDNSGISPTTISTGSAKHYQTTVDRKTEGDLSAEDFRQASLLTSRIVFHMNKAGAYVGDDRKDLARQELEKALALTSIVRRLLPTTTVTTIVRDKDGKEVYRYVDRVQEDRIPLHEGLIAVNMMEPITDAKHGEASVRGVRLADAELLHTSVLVNLDYVEAKLNRAQKLLNEKPDDALAQLLLAQSRGVDFVVNKQDDPLVKAQLALQLAERMVAEGREDAAKANLQFAKNHLELYRTLLPSGKSEHVGKLQGEITKLQGEIGRKGAAASIRGYWDRVSSWFVKKPGETRAPGAESETPKTGTKSDTSGIAGTDKPEKPER